MRRQLCLVEQMFKKLPGCRKIAFWRAVPPPELPPIPNRRSPFIHAEDRERSPSLHSCELRLEPRIANRGFQGAKLVLVKTIVCLVESRLIVVRVRQCLVGFAPDRNRYSNIKSCVVEVAGI